MDAHPSDQFNRLVIIIMGVSGSGKSTVGPLLAALLECHYLEGDSFHLPASIEKMAAGIALDDEDRWPWLSRLAGEIDKHVEESGCVVASCSALKRKYRDTLRKHIGNLVVFVHLVAEPVTLESRISSRGAHYMPASLLTSQLQSLEPLANDENALILSANTDVFSVVEAAHKWVVSLVAQQSPLP